MKALINGVTYVKEYTTKFGVLHLHKISYNGSVGFYSSKKKDQTYFKLNQECEFTEEKQQGQNGEYIKVKPISSGGNYSNYSKAVKKEQSKYSGFAMAYAKDLFVAGKVNSLDEMYLEAQNMIDWMVLKDKELES